MELGGVPIATAMSRQSGLPVVFVRKEAKTYGACRAVEGGDIQGRKTVIVEDVISTGGAVRDATALLRREGAEIFGAVCAIWRGEVIGTPLAAQVFALTDATYEQDGRFF